MQNLDENPDTKAYLQCAPQSPSIDHLTLLPLYSFVIQFTFTLAQPYISRDEQEFYIIDNPVRKDKLTGQPYVAATTWKGCLRSALCQLKKVAAQQGKASPDAPGMDSVLKRLFGVAQEEDKKENLPEEFRAGRLHFYPAFFDRKSLEVINPHDRDKGVGTVPILIESVPKDAKGNFTVLYVPFDLVGADDAACREQVSEDMVALVAGLAAMFTLYGFGAKTSSGFGLASEDLVGGMLDLRANDTETSTDAAPPVQQPLARYLEAHGRLKPEYLNADGSFKYRQKSDFERNDGKGKGKLDKAAWQLYEKAKRFWEREGKQRAEADNRAKEPGRTTASDPAASLPPPRWVHRTFSAFDELTSRTTAIAAQLMTGGSQ